MTCPYGYLPFEEYTNAEEKRENFFETTVSKSIISNEENREENLTYHDHIQLNKLFSCLTMQSSMAGHPVPDEHFFITVHQTFELWFRQINFDIDQIRNFLNPACVDDNSLLQIICLLERNVKVLNLLIGQIQVLETMSPLDFCEFRKYLKSASAYQSLQFRLLENKFGVLPEQRIYYNAKNYKEAFKGNELEKVEKSEQDTSLFVLIENWLEKIYIESIPDGFWLKYLNGIENYLLDIRKDIEKSNMHEDEKQQNQEAFEKIKRNFESVISEKKKENGLKNERRLSQMAVRGALIISFNRKKAKFSQPYLILKYLKSGVQFYGWVENF